MLVWFQISIFSPIVLPTSPCSNHFSIPYLLSCLAQTLCYLVVAALSSTLPCCSYHSTFHLLPSIACHLHCLIPHPLLFCPTCGLLHPIGATCPLPLARASARLVFLGFCINKRFLQDVPIYKTWRFVFLMELIRLHRLLVFVICILCICICKM